MPEISLSYSWAARLTEYRAALALSAVLFAGFLNALIMTRANAIGSPTGASKSCASKISDGPDGQSVETAEQPQARASTSTVGNPSRRDDSTKSEARDMKA